MRRLETLFVLLLMLSSLPASAATCIYEWNGGSLAPDGVTPLNWNDSTEWTRIHGDPVQCSAGYPDDSDHGAEIGNGRVVQNLPALRLESLLLENGAVISNDHPRTIDIFGSDLSFWKSGDFVGTGTVTINTRLFIDGTSTDPRRIRGGQTFRNVYYVEMSNPNRVRIDGVSSLRNEGEFVLHGDGGFSGITAEGAGEIENTGTFRKSQGAMLQASVISNPFANSGIVRAESGNLRINNYTQTAGTTWVGAGAFFRTQTGSVFSGGQITGNGTVDVNLLEVDGASVAPGSSPGVLTIDGNYVQTAVSALEIELAGPIPGSEHDQLVVTGNATLSGALEITRLGGYQPGLGDSFVILTAASVSGTFDSISEPARFDVVYEPDRVLLVSLAAPVPALSIGALAWLCGGLLATGALATRRRTRRR